MGIQIGSESDEEEVISVINTTPLVDVMLVLLIIFLITIPVVTQTIAVKLPEERNQRYEAQINNITLAVNSKGEMFWNEQQLSNQAQLLSKLKQAAIHNPKLEVHIHGDQQTAFESIGDVISTVQQAGIAKVAFITQPAARGAGS
ncbi:outer membrane transport energization protein ExbD [Acinetobacter calcoaceticus]|uniref:Outer membrane transport energization protein ExbD n=1 Tax=Acinetobacter calcoaceticus TaxID=471 RepID=A0A4R1XW87_ACICA|nr:outer membrane transport energization protein ExbD [Acinetobacter calcoaceticus]